ncbi:MAG: hypothetical protein JXL80_06915 [Planctomycetes bacterium]|nr:hypothetical protein [Planctomycetota bacterium]
MPLLGECFCVSILESIDLTKLMILLQFVGLLYLAFAFRRIARNQVELAEYLKSKLDKDD